MRKVIAAINTTIDGVLDHTAGIPDEAIHQHYAELLENAGVILYGRITYELMQFWQTLLNNPSGEKTMDDFAVAIDRIPKIVFSNQLQNTNWDSATLASKSLEELVTTLKQESGKDILVGSRSLIIKLLNLNLIDEFQLCIHPVIAGSGMLLFENINIHHTFNLTKTKIFENGAIVLYYEPIKKS